MVELTRTFDKTIAGDRFEIACISYEGVREASGFQRRVLTTRPQYKVNGKVVSRAIFFTLRDAGRAALKVDKPTESDDVSRYEMGR